jgi:AraC-like DNA-binding protein
VSPASVPVIFTVGGEFISKMAWKHEVVCNDDYELIVGLNGTLYLKVDGEQLTIRPNDLVVVPKGTRIEGWRESAELSFIWLHFLPAADAKLAEFSHEQLRQMIKTKSDRQFALPLKFRLKETDRFIIETYQLLNSLIVDEYRFEEQNLLMTHILLMISSEFTQSFQDQQDGHLIEVRVKQVENWICEHLDSNMTVNRVSEAFGLSNQYLSRLFKEHVGMTIIQFINIQKVKVAQVLLLESALSVKEIGNLSFFRSEKQFFLQFKKITGTTPQKFRDAHGTIHTNNPRIDPDLPMPKQATLILRNNQSR